MAGWGGNFHGQATPQSGVFRSVSAGFGYSVALRDDGTAVSWGQNDWGQGTTPAGKFVVVAAGYHTSAGIRLDGSILVWGLMAVPGFPPPPTGTFIDVAVGVNFLAAIRTDGTLVAWGNPMTVPTGTFSQVNAAGGHAEGLRIDGEIVVFGSDAICYNPPPPGPFVRIGKSAAGLPSGIRPDGTIVAWFYSNGPCSGSAPPVPVGRFAAISMKTESGYAIPVCAANCDLSTNAPVLNANDFQCFLNSFAAAQPFANCDGSTQMPVLNVNDFQCFLNSFAAGCP